MEAPDTEVDGSNEIFHLLLDTSVYLYLLPWKLPRTFIFFHQNLWKVPRAPTLYPSGAEGRLKRERSTEMRDS